MLAARADVTLAEIDVDFGSADGLGCLQTTEGMTWLTMMTDVNMFPPQTGGAAAEVMTENPWPRALAAGSLLAGAFLLLAGRRRAALAAAVAGAAVATLERPEVVKEIWENTPKYLRAGQDFLLRAEDVVDDLRAKAEKVRGMLNRS